MDMLILKRCGRTMRPDRILVGSSCVTSAECELPVLQSVSILSFFLELSPAGCSDTLATVLDLVSGACSSGSSKVLKIGRLSRRIGVLAA